MISTRSVVSWVARSSSPSSFAQVGPVYSILKRNYTVTTITEVKPKLNSRSDVSEESLTNSNMIILNLVRHGETEMNRADIVQSRTPGDLTQRGIQMAESLGKFLKDEKFHRVYTSDLKRCHDTTLNILKHNQAPPEPILKPVLRERDYGDLEFKPSELVRDLVRTHRLPNHAVPIPGGESHTDVMKRCAEFFQELCQLADKVKKPENILAVSHGAWIMCFLDHLSLHTDIYELKNYIHEQPDKRPLLNTGRTKLVIGKMDQQANNNDAKRLIQFIDIHCVKHLNKM